MTSNRVQRRRFAALLALGAIAWAGGVILGARDGGQDVGDNRLVPAASHGVAATAKSSSRSSATRPEARSYNTIARLAGRTIVMRFSGTRAPAYVLRALRVQRAAGVILFRDNVVSSSQLRALTTSLQHAAGGRALIMVDQEGGDIRILRWAAPQQPPAAVSTPAQAAAHGRSAAKALRDHGINVNLAPVADVAVTPQSVMRTRAFPGNADAVGRLVAASVRAYRGTGVLPTAKHFPGLGDTPANTDFGGVTIPGKGQLRGFRAAVGAGVPLVMSSHALYPDLDAEHIASQSRPLLTTVLRGRLGFKGVVMTDSLEAKAVLQRSATSVAGVRSMEAGNDLLLTTGKGSYLEVLRALVRRARADAPFLARVREAEARVAALPRS